MLAIVSLVKANVFCPTIWDELPVTDVAQSKQQHLYCTISIPKNHIKLKYSETASIIIVLQGTLLLRRYRIKLYLVCFSFLHFPG